jgi:NADPH-dependent 2,4-dienoyl-CoA reductase/sulfur reductase-like enzyme
MPAENYDVVIIGGGPSGMSAASILAEHSVKTLLIDENGRLGGQLWRGYTQSVGTSRIINLSATTGYRNGRLHIHSSACVLGIFPDKSILLSTKAAGIKEIKAKNILFATGAREKVRPFKGWTLPEVMTVGGAQLLLKNYNVLAASEMLISGAGPLIYLLSGDVLSRGGKIAALLDRSSFMGVLGVTRLMRGQLSKFGQGVSSFSRMFKGKILPKYRTQIVKAERNADLIEVTSRKISSDGTIINGASHRYKTQMITVTNGFVGNVELAQLAGCKLGYSLDKGGWFVTVDSLMQTSLNGMFAAGELTGVAGGSKAMVEGQLAALSILYQSERISNSDFENKRKPLLVNRTRYQRFGAYLNRQWAIPGKEWDSIDDDTMICRCEDITLGKLRSWIKAGFTSSSVLKNATRCGMGNCQGRTCGPLIYDIIAAYAPAEHTAPFSTRMPIKPVPLGDLAQMSSK